MYIPDIELHEATSIDDATSLLERFAPDARILAGGTDLLVDLKIGRRSVGHVISIGGVHELRGIGSADGGLRISAMTTLAERVINGRLSVRQTEAAIRTLMGKGGAKGSGKGKSPSVRDLEVRLARHLGTRCDVVDRGGKGSLTVHYSDLDELDRILEKIF